MRKTILSILLASSQMFLLAQTASDPIPMVNIPAGSFYMGGTGEGEDFDEKPIHKVILTSGFRMSATEITNAQYEAFDPSHKALRGKNGFSKEDDEAVVYVNYHEAMAFCKWLSEKEGKNYRLPTEAEWEYAVRGGTETPYFFEGNPKDFSDQGFWRKFFDADTEGISPFVIYAKNSGNRTQEPSSVEANPFGLKNMLGNVMEYCADKYNPDAYGKWADQVENPINTEGEEWVVRGGYYASDAADVRCAARSHTEHDAWLKTDPQQPKSIWWYSDIKGIGFRVVCEMNQ